MPDTLSEITSDKICYLSIDMGIVYPEMATLGRLWDRLVPGAVVVTNHYAFKSYPELQESYDNFAAKRKLRMLTMPTGQGILIKLCAFLAPYLEVFESAFVMI